MGVTLGVDIGSVSIDTALLNDKREVIEAKYIRTRGQPVQKTVEALKELLGKYEVKNIAFTGSGGKLLGKITGCEFVNEILAQAKGTFFLHPEVRTIIEIGGEDSKLIMLNEDGTIKDFSMNAICAAGTGSFLDQQASRLKVSIENEFGALALKSKNPPRIAGRCSVFAKSDMIHLQQEGCPDYDIIAGLCFALARSYMSNIVKGKKLEREISFQGGVASNQGMVQAFKEILDTDIIIPKYHANIGAIGACLTILNKKNSLSNNIIADIENFFKTHKNNKGNLQPLSISEELDLEVRHSRPNLTEKVDAYIGVDVGSISTNVAVIDKNKRLLSRVYLRTSGRPIEAVREGIKQVRDEIGDFINVKGIGTTGSGRYLLGKFIGADIVKNEITAQARATIEHDPNVDTIFEIGGQDSKFISIKNKAVVDFEMNKVCAAGTGSFLEEQAEKLDISIEKEFGKIACCAESPISLGERCTVFMESELNAEKQNGANKDDLIAGLSYSIALNYLNKVVGRKKIGNNIYFQGAVAFNKGVVAAFRELLGRDIKVTPDNDVTGAIGIALIARENVKEKTSFRGFDKIINMKYSLGTFICHSCENVCEIKKVQFQDEPSVFYGSRCEKYDVDASDHKNNMPDLVEERNKILLRPYKPAWSTAKSVGIPFSLVFYELYPFWNAFFSELGFNVVLSSVTNKTIIQDGSDNITAEFCFPVKVSHGHVIDLIKKKVDYIFLPSIINYAKKNRNISNSYNCPYVQTLPYILSSAIWEKLTNALSPVIHFQHGIQHLKRDILKFVETIGVDKERAIKALKAALKFQEEFYLLLEKKGKEILANLKDNSIVVVARPYNGYDPGLNLDLSRKLRNLGILAIPMDFLELGSVDISGEFPNMYWRQAQKILSAAEIIKKNNKLFALYITNFGCGPDSFVIRYFQKKMGNKPFLALEVDEHSADAGAITRCEAFLDSVKNYDKHEDKANHYKEPIPLMKLDKARKIWIPYMGNGSYALSSALKVVGYKASIIPMANEDSMALGRKYTNGKECLPMIITTGDMVSLAKTKDFNRKCAFFMGLADGPCRFGQYSKTQRIILDDLGYDDVPIVTLMAEDSIFFTKLFKHFWHCYALIECLGKLLRKNRPYEIKRGEADKLYMKLIEKISAAESIKEIKNIGQEAKLAFKNIHIKDEKKPLIGVVGEIYVRNHEISNEDIIRKIEEYGGEAWLAPATEWFLYVNKIKQYSCRHSRSGFWDTLKIFLYNKINNWQYEVEHFYHELFKEMLQGYDEPDIDETILNSKPYLDASFEGEAILSIGKAADFVKKGASGIVNVGPFTCMPSTIVTSLQKKFRKNNNDIPFITIFFDGSKEANSDTRLEAFMHQARQYNKKMSVK